MRVSANGIAIEIDDSGPPDGPPLLLVMGLGMQLTAWPVEFVQLLRERGFRVIRFDNRDSGLSEGFDALGVPNVPLAAMRRLMNLPVRSPYSVADMAADALGVLDALGIVRAHVCGISLGGMVAQHLAAREPERVASLTLMMTTTGGRGVPKPGPRAQFALMSSPPSHAREDVIAHLMRVFTAIGSPAYRPDPDVFRTRVAESVDRAYRPAGTARQFLAVAADPDRTPLLERIAAPTHIIHGVHDPLVPVGNGHDLHARIAGATGDFVGGMGHDLPQPLLERFADAIVATARRVA